MFLSKLALYGSIAGTFFAVSAFSTIQISKYMNKTPIPNEVEEEEEDTYVRQMSDTEKFINELTVFGNMEGYLDATITKDEYTININGNVFVSMETMEDIQVDANLNVRALNRNFNIKATYINETIYTTIEGNNLKLQTSDINDIVDLFSIADSSLELPDAFKNIDPNALITNISAMTAEVGSDKITYTCNLIEGIPPIIFTSDLNYKMTGLSLSNVDIDGFKINVTASTNILGKGNNRVVVPETNTNQYTNITSYFGVIKQIKNLINDKQSNIDYSINLSKGNDVVLDASGEASINLKDGLDIVLSGTVNQIKDKTTPYTYLVGYQNEKAFINFNDSLKMSFEPENQDKFEEALDSATEKDAFKAMMEGLENIDLPLIKMINNKDFAGLLANYKTISLNGNQAVITLSNGMFNKGNTSDFVITINYDNDGISSLKVTNLKFKGYTLSLSLTLKEFAATEVDLSTYDSVSNVDLLLNYVFNTVGKKDFNMNGHINANLIDVFDVANISLSARVHIDENNKTLGVVVIDNIPQFKTPLGTVNASDDSWDYRKLTMYITDDEVYLDVYYYDDYTEWVFWNYRKTTTKHIRLTMEDFTKDLAYYLVNYGLGITTGSILGNSLDMRNQSESEHNTDYSKVLTNYESTSGSNPSWTVGISLYELTGVSTSILGNLDATIYGNSETNLLSSVTATTTLASVINATITANLIDVNTVDVSDGEAYIETHKNDTEGHSYEPDPVVVEL